MNLLLFLFCCFWELVFVEAGSNHIAILAQGRSGSTFLSSWFGTLPNVNYFIEPCSMVYSRNVRKDRTGLDCAKFMDELFACNFSRADVERNQNAFIPEKAKKGFKGWGHQGGEMDISQCSSRRAHVIKELRVGEAWAHQAVSFDKVLVLFRDPRAILSSRQKDWPAPLPSYTAQDGNVNPHGWNGQTGFPYSQSIRSLCMEHLSMRKRLGEGILKVEYSLLLQQPEVFAKTVMEFTNLSEFLPEVLDHVKRNRNGTCENPGSPFSVCRENLGLQDDKWKTELHPNVLQTLKSIVECQHVIKLYDDDGKTEL